MHILTISAYTIKNILKSVVAQCRSCLLVASALLSQELGSRLKSATVVARASPASVARQRENRETLGSLSA